MEFWKQVPANLRTAIVTSVILVIGAASEAAISWFQALTEVPPI